MSIRRDIPQIHVLRERVERRFGKRLSVHADFLALVSVIEMELRQHISESTLERVWGYSTRGYDTVSLRTLDVLSTYAEGCSWHDFCHRLQMAAECESELFSVEHISTADLQVGDRLQIGWLPNRRCVIRYVGENRFMAESCENSKMQPGDSFSCLQFTLGKELVMCDFIPFNTSSPTFQSYIVGSRNGLTSLCIVH